MRPLRRLSSRAIAGSSALLLLAGRPAALAAAPPDAIRVNQLGYLPDAPKVAVVCSLAGATYAGFTVTDLHGRRVLGPLPAKMSGQFGPCATTARLDFSALRRPGRYLLVATTAGAALSRLASPVVRIDAHAYDGAADTLLYYMREQRSGWNPLFHDSLHTHDGIIVDSPRAGQFVPVSGGWADASDYLQYVTTSANATYAMLMAYRDHPGAFADHFDANGSPGANGVPDVLDEARHGLEWLLRMFPDDSEMFNQLADDRDHTYFDLPTNDSSDYGWGKGKERPVYPCTGKPQGLFQYRNRSTGKASTAGKYASAFALAASLFAERDPAFAARLRRRAAAAYAIGRASPGVCQTAPGRAPYFYEEDNWVDDMELGAAELAALTHDRSYLAQALAYAAQEPVTPWMGADTARHYEWYPWYNAGHYEAWRVVSGAREGTRDEGRGTRSGEGTRDEGRGTRERGSRSEETATRKGITTSSFLHDYATAPSRPSPLDPRRSLETYYRTGLQRVAARATNGFRVGIPFIWCSNNLMASFATQALLYRRMTGDGRFREYEQAAIDWLFGTNPWGVSMIIGLPHDGVFAHDPHSVVASRLGIDKLLGGMLDGPVYRSIFQNLRGIALLRADEYAPWNTGFIVYHDDLGDYSTNEPIMDGTANLTYLLSALQARGR